MPLGRQRDHCATVAKLRTRQWVSVVQHLSRRRSIVGSSSTQLPIAAWRYTSYRVEEYGYAVRKQTIAHTSFEAKFEMFPDSASLELFRFRKQDLRRVIAAVYWPEERAKTRRSRYAVSPLLATCVLLRRLATPARQCDLELLIGRYGWQLSEILWETVEAFVKERNNLLMGPVSATFSADRAACYAEAVRDISIYDSDAITHSLTLIRVRL